MILPSRVTRAFPFFFALCLGRGDAHGAPSVVARIATELAAPEPSRRARAARELPVLDPTSARPLVRAAIDDLDLDVRVAATQAVGRLLLDDFTPTLIERASASDPRQRDAAVEALGHLHTVDEQGRAIDATLVRALADSDATLRAVALRALAMRPAAAVERSAALDAITTLLADESPELRRLAAETLEKFRDKRALNALAARVDDVSPEVRLAVARALGALDDVRAAPAVLRLLDDPSEDVRAAALTTIGELAAAIAVPRLEVFMTRARDPLVGPAAIALGRIAGRDDTDHTDGITRALRSRASDVLVEAVRQGDNRASALEGVHASGSAAGRALAPLLPALGTAPADDVLLLAGELAATGERGVVALLLERAVLATDGRFDAALVRARPEKGLAREHLVVWLAMKLSDKFVGNRRAAAMALAQLGDPRAAPVLTAVLADPDGEVRRNALRALLAAHAAPTVLLLATSRGADLELARVALAALGERHEEVARQELVTALTSTDAASRQAAAQALAQDGGATTVVPTLLSLVKSGPKASREAILFALSGPLRGHPDATARELCLALGSTDEPGAAGAVELLGAMRDSAAADRMIAMIPRLGRRPVRRARLYAALGDVLLSGSNSNIERTLISAVGGEPDSIARASAAWALGKAQRSSDGAVARVLTMRLGDPSGIVRCNALAALARLQQTPEPDRLARLGRDLDVGVRANVVRQGGVVGTGDQSPLVRNAQNARKRSPVVAPHGKDYLLVRLLAADEVFSARIGLADGLTVFFVADERGFVRDEGVATGDLVLDSEEPRTVD